MTLTAAQRAKHVEATEALREHWSNRVRPQVAKQLKPLYTIVSDGLRTQSPHALVSKVSESLADAQSDWENLLLNIAHQVGDEFAHASVTELADRLGHKFDPANRMYTTTRDTFIGNYSKQRIPVRLAAMHRGIVKRVEHTFEVKAATLYRVERSIWPSGRQYKGDGLVATATPDSNLDEYIQEYGSVDEDFQAMFGDVGTYIADSEAVLASNLGSLAGVVGYGNAMGIELVKIWNAVGDDRTRRTHDDADGQTQLLQDPFNVGGAELMFPMDESMGAGSDETERCRCVESFDQGDYSTPFPEDSAAAGWADDLAAASDMNWGEQAVADVRGADDVRLAGAEAAGGGTTTLPDGRLVDNVEGVLSNQSDPSPALPSSYHDLNTLKGIESWLKATYGIENVDLGGLDIDTANALMREFTRLADQYPEVAGRLKYVFTKSGDMGQYLGDKFANMRDMMSKPWYMAADNRTGVFLYINDTLMADPSYLEIMEASARAGYNPDGTGSIQGMVSHEWGHLMEAWYRTDPVGARNVERLLALPFEGSDISAYARSLAIEQWAEAFAATQYGSDAVRESAYVQALADFIEKGTAYMRQVAAAARNVS